MVTSNWTEREFAHDHDRIVSRLKTAVRVQSARRMRGERGEALSPTTGLPW